MSSKTKNKKDIMPRLRFSEFRDAESWYSNELERIVQTIAPPQKIQTSEYCKEGLFPIIDQSQSSIAGWTDNRNAVITDGLPLIIFGDHTCILKIAHDPFAQGADGIKIFNGSSEVDTLYLYQFLQANPLKVEEYKRHFSILKNKKVFYPKRESGEQKKIADCLSSLDDLIEAEAQKLDALKYHKKGLMQELFPAEGETLPKCRFPEFQNAPEWEMKPLGMIGQIITGKTPSTADKSLWGGDIQFVTPTDISEDKYQLKTQRTVTRNAKIKLLPKNSIMFTCIASIGKMALSVEPCITNQQINTLVPNKGHDNEFVYYSLLKIVPLIKGTQANSTLPIINKTEFSKFSIPVPRDYAEQQRVAGFLSSIDDIIAAQSRRLDALRDHKKGLMQQLFPAISDDNKG
jgi:type I restriction enzyme, S subunit